MHQNVIAFVINCCPCAMYIQRIQKCIQFKMYAMSMIICRVLYPAVLLCPKVALIPFPMSSYFVNYPGAECSLFERFYLDRDPLTLHDFESSLMRAIRIRIRIRNFARYIVLVRDDGNDPRMEALQFLKLQRFFTALLHWCDLRSACLLFLHMQSTQTQQLYFAHQALFGTGYADAPLTSMNQVVNEGLFLLFALALCIISS